VAATNAPSTIRQASKRTICSTSRRGALRCLAELSGNSCGSPNTCPYESAVASGPLLAYPSCNGWEQQIGSVVFNADTNQTQLVPQITRR